MDRPLGSISYSACIVRLIARWNTEGQHEELQMTGVNDDTENRVVFATITTFRQQLTMFVIVDMNVNIAGARTYMYV